jgi:hypothetical protein
MPDARPIASAPMANSTSPTSSVRLRPMVKPQMFHVYSSPRTHILGKRCHTQRMAVCILMPSDAAVLVDCSVRMEFATYAVTQHAAHSSANSRGCHG